MEVRLVTKNPRRFSLEGVHLYLNFTELKEEQDLNSDDLLIVNDYSEDDYRAGIEVSRLVQQNSWNHFMYLSDKPRLNMMAIVAGLGGLVDTEDYLTDQETLNILILDMYDESRDQEDQSSKKESINNEVNKLLNNVNIEVIQTFYRDFALGKIDLTNKRYINRVKTAISDLSGVRTNMDDFTNDIFNNIEDLFKESTKALLQLEDEVAKLKTKNADLQDKLDIIQGTQEEDMGDGNMVQNFSSYKVVSDYGTHFIVFKEYSAVRYLTSFIMGYKNHLESALNKRVRLIFVIPNKFDYIEKYKKSPANFQYYNIENEIYKNEESYINNVGFTEKPIRKLYQYFSGLNDDYILVVDRTQDSTPSVSGRVDTWHCFSGKTEADLHTKVDSKRIFTMKGITDNDIVIPHIKGYPELATERVVAYDQSVNKQFLKMDEQMGIKKG